MEVTKWLKPSISVSQTGDRRECAGSNASERRAILENEQCAGRPRQPYRGRLIRLDEMSEAIRSGAAPG